VVVAVAAAAAAVALAVGRLAAPTASGPPAVHAALPARAASYLGVYLQGPPPDRRRVAAFARAADREPGLVGYFSGWAQPFAAAFARSLHHRGVAPLVQLDPTGASVRAIAVGGYDEYLRSFADSVRRFGHPVVLGFAHEMNATWYPWGFRHVRAATFIAAWRHLVGVFRARGADNVTWLWTCQADTLGTGPVRAWWPGQQYVTWVGVDGYYYRPYNTFYNVFGRTLIEIRAFTRKPVLLSETAVGPAAGQAAKIADLFRGMASYHTLGLVWFDIAQHHGIYHQDWRIEDHQAAEAAFRRAARTSLAAQPRGR
jgi:hypothetical protein